MIRITLPLMLALTLSACAPLPTGPGETGGGESPSGASRSGEDPSAALRPSTVLLEQGRTQAAAGNYPEAAVALERAVRIDPGNAWLWLELGKIHYANGDMRQAAAHAKKASSLAGDDREAERAAEDLLDAIARR